MPETPEWNFSLPSGFSVLSLLTLVAINSCGGVINPQPLPPDTSGDNSDRGGPPMAGAAPTPAGPASAAPTEAAPMSPAPPPAANVGDGGAPNSAPRPDGDAGDFGDAGVDGGL